MNRDSKGAPKTPEPSLADRAKSNRSQLGDPVSLKAETSSRSPTESDKGAARQRDSATGPGSLADRAKKNPTALGDPVSLKAETSDTEPTEHDRGARGSKGNSKL